MKTVYIIVFFVLIAVSNTYAYDYQEGGKNWDKWVACTADVECVPIHDECGGWTAVNKQFKTEGEEYQNELAAAVKCAYVKMEPAPKTLCLEQMCSVKPSNLENGVK